MTVSNKNVLSVENVNSTNNFSGTINKVTQLAKVATMVSVGNTGDIKDKDGNKITSRNYNGNIVRLRQMMRHNLLVLKPLMQMVV